MLRLDKFLCDMKIGSRSEVKERIRKGAVRVNGTLEKDPGRKIDEKKDQVQVEGQDICYRKYVYLLLNKPSGLVSASRDEKERTVLDWIREKDRENALLGRELFPVGRLDKDTEGLLLITDDGELAHRLLSPSRHVEKTYYVETDKDLPSEQQERLREGVVIGDGETTRPARLERAAALRPDAAFAWLLTITEGKYHQVKRMMKAAGTTVTYLKRLSMGPLRLEEGFETGSFRELTEKECAALGVCADGSKGWTD